MGETEKQPPSNTVVPPAVDEVAAQDGQGDLHLSPRVFSLAQAPLMNHNHSNNAPQHRAEDCDEKNRQPKLSTDHDENSKT